jgi:Cu+-exporting ATPase
VLIVACPCALALSKPFTYGNIMRQMGRRGLYLKNTGVIPNMNKIRHIVFDKTGTLTKNEPETIRFVGEELSAAESHAVELIAESSTHPLSRMISNHLSSEMAANHNTVISEFEELSGQGVSGSIAGMKVRIGSAAYVGSPEKRLEEETASHISINGIYKGKFVFSSVIREGVVDMINQLKGKYELHVLSGDQEKDRELIEQMIPNKNNIRFSCTPQEKSRYILELQRTGEPVLMIGDGLNDAGALENANVGIAVSEDMFRFTPSSDAIITADHLAQLDRFLKLSNYADTVLKICLGFSLTYNLVGLSFAVTGNLTPLIAAILMPISSITIVAVATFSTVFRRWK